MNTHAAVLRRLRSHAAVHGRKPRRRKPPRWIYPTAAERKYRTQLQGRLNRLRDLVRTQLLPKLPALLAEAALHRATPDARADAWPEALAQLLVQFRLQMDRDAGGRERVAAGVADEVSAWNRGQWGKIITRTLGVDLMQQEPWLRNELKGWAVENASLINSLEEEAIGQVEKWTLRGIRTGERHEAVAKKIEERFGVSKSKARLIARDQTAKLNGNLTQIRQTEVGVTEYIWRTAGDDRVRPSHRAHNGKRYRWDSPPADTGAPGSDFNCRCSAEPVLDGLLAGLNEIEQGG